MKLLTNIIIYLITIIIIMTSVITVYFTNNQEKFGDLIHIPRNIIEKIKSKSKYVCKFHRNVYTFRCLNLILQNNTKTLKQYEEINIEHNNNIIIQTRKEYDKDITYFPIINKYNKSCEQNVEEYTIMNTKLYLVSENTNSYIEIFTTNTDIIKLFI